MTPLILPVPSECIRSFLSYSPIFLLKNMLTMVMTVMNPTPPVWMSSKMTICPKIEKCTFVP